MKNKYKYVDSKVLGDSPAAVYMDSGIIEINKDVWHKFTPYERAFIIKHEKGHFLLPTQFEKEADTYALLETQKINKNALGDAINTLVKMNLKDKSRLKSLYYEALLFKKTGQTSFMKINNNINDMRQKQNSTDSPFLRKAAANGNPLNALKKTKKKKNNKKRAVGDAEENLPVTTTTYGKSHKINGFSAGNMYFSITNILLAAILVTLFVISGKIKK